MDTPAAPTSVAALVQSVRAERGKLRLSRRVVAARARLNPVTVVRFEGGADTRLAAVVLIAEALGGALRFVPGAAVAPVVLVPAVPDAQFFFTDPAVNSAYTDLCSRFEPGVFDGMLAPFRAPTQRIHLAAAIIALAASPHLPSSSALRQLCQP